MSIYDWIAAVTAGAGVAVVVVSALAIVFALKGVRDQMRVSIFITYTERYSRVMANLPFEVRRPSSGYRLEDATEKERIAVRTAFRDYMNMCSEEMWLHVSRGIDEKTWRVWKRGMSEVARFPSFSEIWNDLSRDYEVFFPEFTAFMQKLVDEVRLGSPGGAQDASASQHGAPP